MPPSIAEISTEAMEADAAPRDATALGTLGEIYERYGDRLTRFCATRLSDPSGAEDACHETILKAHRHANRFDGGRAWPWLVAIAANLCVDIERKRKAASLWATPPNNNEQGTPYDEMMRHQREELVAEAMNRIPEHHRTLLYLRDVEGWSWEELAEQRGTTLPGVRSALWRAHSVLRRVILEVARERHWPLPAAIGLIWSRLRQRMTRARVRVDTAIARYSNHEGVVSLMANDTAARITTGAVATLAVVVPLTFASSPQADRSARQATETEVAILHNPDVDDASHRPGHGDAMTSTGPDGDPDDAADYTQIPPREPHEAAEPPPADVVDAGEDPVTVAPPPDAESPQVPVSGSTSTGGVESDDDGHDVTGPSASLDLGDDAPEEADEVNTGATTVHCGPEERSTAMSVVCAPIDAVDGEPTESPNDEAEPSPEEELSSDEPIDDDHLTQT